MFRQDTQYFIAFKLKHISRFPYAQEFSTFVNHSLVPPLVAY